METTKFTKDSILLAVAFYNRVMAYALECKKDNKELQECYGTDGYDPEWVMCKGCEWYFNEHLEIMGGLDDEIYSFDDLSDCVAKYTALCLNAGRMSAADLYLGF